MLTHVPEALVFDIFGTVFDWRSTVTSYLERVISQKLSTIPSSSNASSLRDGNPDLSDPSTLRSFCTTFAQQWRDSYKDFVGNYSKNGSQDARWAMKVIQRWTPTISPLSHNCWNNMGSSHCFLLGNYTR